MVCVLTPQARAASPVPINSGRLESLFAISYLGERRSRVRKKVFRNGQPGYTWVSAYRGAHAVRCRQLGLGAKQISQKHVRVLEELPSVPAPAPHALRPLALEVAGFFTLALASGCTVHTAPVLDTTEGVQADYLTPVVGAVCPGEDAETAGVRASIARVRAMAGLGALDCDAAAMAAATGHCGYVLANGKTLTHVETKGKPQFFGVNFLGPPRRQVVFRRRGRRGDEQRRGSRGRRRPARLDEQRLPSRALPARRQHPLRLRPCDRVCRHRLRSAARELPRLAASSRVAARRRHQRADGVLVVERDAQSSPGDDHRRFADFRLITAESLDNVKAVLEGPSGTVASTLITSKNDGAKLVHAGEVHLVPNAPLAGNTTYTARFTAKADD